jgi:outer membrane protein OmpA-like peptidoglycan-associated protein
MNEPHRLRDEVDPPAGSALERYRPRLPALVGLGVGAVLLAAMLLFVRTTVASARERLTKPEAPPVAVAVADDAEASYCTPQFKQVLQRVLNACGLVGGEARRGCQPADVKTLASINDKDFNALFTPLKDRGAVLMFDDNQDKLDPAAIKLLDDRWLERKGARYFFVVARASRTGPADLNRTLSHKRANSVYFHIQQEFKDPDLDKQVGLLWLGDEFAQLSKEYCSWPNTRPDKPCSEDAINRTAFASWVDCRL